MTLQTSGNGTWIKLNEAAHKLGVSEITLRRRIKTGKIPHEFREGRYYVFLSENEPRGKEMSGEMESQRLRTLSTLPQGFGQPSRDLILTELKRMKVEIERRDQFIRKLQRQLEDQQTLIRLLEAK